MLLVHVPKLTNRIGYTLHVLLGNVLRIPFEITTDADTFLAHVGPRLCYSPERLMPEAVWVKCDRLLQETTLEDMEPLVTECQGIPALFPVYGKGLDFNFDLFSATFYMTSRYEEYLPHRTDAHGRFSHTESLAYREGFLLRPVVDLWGDLLRRKLIEYNPDYQMPACRFSFEPTVDIDAAYCYRGKGFWRTLVGFAKDLLQERDPALARRRWRVLLGKEEDPFNTFEDILALSEKYPNVELTFFALMADYGPFDKNISYHNRDFCQLLKHLADYVRVGIHTSYASFDEPARIGMEANRLQDILHHSSRRSRAHFLRISLPHSYRELLRHNIHHDYTMGYADHPGFRAGISVPYPFFDIEEDSEKPLTIHPFCMMDVTLKRHMALSNEQTLNLFHKIVDELHQLHGTCSMVFHNQYLCEDYSWPGWRQVFEQMWEYGANKNL